MTKLQKQLLAALKKRKSKPEPFGYGITTADQYVREVRRCAGDEACKRRFADSLKNTDLNALVKEAARTLTYAHEDMGIEKDGVGIVTNSSDFASILKAGSKTEIPPRTLMVFRNIVTTPRVDRDGDILMTEGAEPDLKMPLLWQHLHAAPVGKMLEVIEHSKKLLRVASAVIDSPMGHDVASLIDFGGLRISHGFLPLAFEELEPKDVGDFPWIGWRIPKFQIMEESVVSVPSNVDAVIETFSRGKLMDPVVKGWAEAKFRERTKIHAGVAIKGGKVTVPGGMKDSVVVQHGADGSVTTWIDTDSQAPAAQDDDDTSDERGTGEDHTHTAGACGCGGSGRSAGDEGQQQSDPPATDPKAGGDGAATDTKPEGKDAVVEAVKTIITNIEHVDAGYLRSIATAFNEFASSKEADATAAAERAASEATDTEAKQFVEELESLLV